MLVSIEQPYPHNSLSLTLFPIRGNARKYTGEVGEIGEVGLLAL
jgi:hypothetical protein